MHSPVEQEHGTVAQLVASDVPVPVSVLKQAVCVDFVFIWTEVQERVRGNVVERGAILSVADVDVIDREFIEGLVWVFLQESVEQLGELVFNRLVDCLALCNFIFSLFDSFNVFLIMINFGVVLPEAGAVSFDFFHGLPLQDKLREVL